MAEFTLDTSGVVTIDGVRVGWRAETAPSGFYLDPFTQGYIEALFESAPLQVRYETGSSAPERRDAGFSDLAPETLAAILKDCAAYTKPYEGLPDKAKFGVQDGRDFWANRQAHAFNTFPPLTPYLGDDGRVYLRPKE